MLVSHIWNEQAALDWICGLGTEQCCLVCWPDQNKHPFWTDCSRVLAAWWTWQQLRGAALLSVSERVRVSNSWTGANHSKSTEFFFFNLFLAVLGLRCCVCTFSLVAVWELLIAVASLVTEHGPRTCGPSCPVGWGIFPDQGLNRCLLNWQADS